MAHDPINGLIYLTTTDFFSSGMAYRMDYTGVLTDSFAVGISPGNIALDVRELVGVNEVMGEGQFSVHPNPSSSVLYIEAEDGSEAYSLMITDIDGRRVYSDVTNHSVRRAVDIENWPAGVYMIYIDAIKGRSSYKIVKY
jgi:hypothetical protein